MRPWTTITTVLFIAFTLLVVSLRFLKRLNFFVIIKKKSSKLWKSERILVKNLFLNVFIYSKGGLRALRLTSIHFLDGQWKVESGFGLCDYGLFDDLLPSIFLATILIGLGINK